MGRFKPKSRPWGSYGSFLEPGNLRVAKYANLKSPIKRVTKTSCNRYFGSRSNVVQPHIHITPTKFPSNDSCSVLSICSNIHGKALATVLCLEKLPLFLIKPKVGEGVATRASIFQNFLGRYAPRAH